MYNNNTKIDNSTYQDRYFKIVSQYKLILFFYKPTSNSFAQTNPKKSSSRIYSC